MLKKMVGNVALSLGSKIVAMVLYMIIDIVLVRMLSVRQYDEWSYFYAIVVICYNVAILGINGSTKVYVAQKSDAYSRKQYIVSGAVVRGAASLGMAVLSLGMLFFASAMGYPDKYPNLQALFLCIPFMIITYTFLDFFKEIYVGLVNFRNIFCISILEFGGSLVGAVIFIQYIPSGVGAAVGYIMGYTLTVFVECVFARSYVKVQGKVGLADVKARGKEIFTYAMPIFGTSLIGSLLVEMDTVMLGGLNPGSTGVYALAKNLMTKATNVNLAICTSTMPVFADINKNNVKGRKQLFYKIIGLNILFVAAVSIGILILGKTVIIILYGENYASVAGILNNLIVYYICYSLSIFPSTLLNYQKKANQALKYNFIMFGCNLVFNLLLIPSYGANGAAVATSLAIIPYTILLFVAAGKVFKVNDKEEPKENGGMP